MKTIIALLVILFAFFADTSALFAYDLPNFTSCINPQWDLKVNHETGTHGIAGRNISYEGKDTVYTTNSGEALTQCFCATDGTGVQTNWWKIPTLTESEIKVLQSQGWIYIPNGALWGLENAPYLAKNSDFSCKSSGGNNGSSNGSGGSSGSNSSSNNSGSGSGVASAAGGIGQVLGLASTGNSVFLLGTALTSGLSLLLGLILKKRAKNNSK